MIVGQNLANQKKVNLIEHKQKSHNIVASIPQSLKRNQSGNQIQEVEDEYERGVSLKFDATLGRDYSEDVELHIIRQNGYDSDDTEGNVDGIKEDGNFKAPPIKSPAQVAAEKLKKLQENYQQELRASFGNNSDRSDRRNSFYKLTNQGTTDGRTFAKFKIEELNEKKKMGTKQ